MQASCAAGPSARGDPRRVSGHAAAVRIERELRLQVYPFIGSRTLRELAKRPSLTQAWISGMKLAAGAKRQVIRALRHRRTLARGQIRGTVAGNPIRINAARTRQPAGEQTRLTGSYQGPTALLALAAGALLHFI